MYVRTIKTRTTTCFQIGKKVGGKFVLIKHVGGASTADQIEVLRLKATDECKTLALEIQPSLFPATHITETAKLTHWRITGFHQVFGHIYDVIGFPANHLRDLTVARIAYPRSKSATSRYLEQYIGISLSEDRIYRFLDTLSKEELTKIAFEFVSKKHNGTALIFYDVTTLYFEANEEDDFRKKGYSKDHKNDLPQIVIGLFVDKDGYPFDFDFYDGSTFEGHTFPKAIEALLKKYTFTDLVVVADAGMLSEANISFLEKRRLRYIVGARLKSMSEQFKKQLFSHDFSKNPTREIWVNQTGKTYTGNPTRKIDDGVITKRLIVEYSQQRAKKDMFTREKLVKGLEAKIASKKTLVKKSKYLLVESDTQVIGIDQGKVELDKRHDGLKGYWTNLRSEIVHTDVINQYHNLWNVEKAFRMSKSDLLERPVFHRKKKRIEGHLLICFCSLLCLKETERLLKQINISLARAVEVLGKVGQGEMRLGKISMPIESEHDETTKLIIDQILGH